MARKQSGPERRFWALVVRLGLEGLQPNDGAAGAVCLSLSADDRGTAVIRDGRLFSDYPIGSGKTPKTYKLIRPDFRLGEDFVEIKGAISARAWASLSRDALNDHIRFALLRMRSGCVPDVRRPYEALDEAEKQVVKAGLVGRGASALGDRLYLSWEALTAVVAAPGENLAEMTVAWGSRKLPVRVVAGLESRECGLLIVIDDEIMRQWDDLSPAQWR
jgi:hypothetical protein